MKKQVSSILKSDLARSSSIILLAIFSSNIILFLANLYLANKLEASDFGVFKTLLYLFAFFALIADLGINFTLTKYIAQFGSKNKEKIGYMVKKLLLYKLFFYIILSILFLLCGVWLTDIFFKDISLNYLILPGILLMFFTFFLTFEVIALGYQKFKLFALSQFLNLTISSVFAILMLPYGIFFIALGYSLGPLIGNIFNIKFFFDNKVIERSKEFDLKSIIYKFSTPMLFTNIVIGLTTLIIPSLSLFFPPSLVGYYSFAFIFYNAMTLIPNALSAVLFPKISELNGLKRHSDAKRIMKRVFMLYTLVVLAGMFFVILFSELTSS